MENRKIEDFTKYLITHDLECIDLRNRDLYNSDLIELIPLLTRLNSIDVLDLAYNHITDFGAMLLFVALKNVRRVILANNDITSELEQKLRERVWSHNIEIIASNRRGKNTLNTDLAQCSLRNPVSHSNLKQYITDYVESFYNNTSNAKPYMTNFLLNCVLFWSVGCINQSFQQLIASRIMPNQHVANERCQEIYDQLTFAVKMAADIERKIQAYKSYILKNKSEEKLLLNEIEALFFAYSFDSIIKQDAYNSLDLSCDLFDFFIIRFKSEIDNSLLFGTTPDWNEFLHRIRGHLLKQIENVRHNIGYLLQDDAEETFRNTVKIITARTFFTMHRNWMLRLVASFSCTLAGRTQTAIDLQSILAELPNEPKPANCITAAWNNAGQIAEHRYRLFEPQPIEPLQQIISAIRLHDVERMVLLLNQHNILNQIDRDGWGLIHHWAVTEKEDSQIFDILINRDSNLVHASIEVTGWNAAFLVLNNCSGTAEVKRYKLKLLLERQLNVMSQDKLHQKLPLHYAATDANDALVEILYLHNRDSLTAIDKYGKTALDYAPPHSATAAFLAKISDKPGVVKGLG